LQIFSDVPLTAYHVAAGQRYRFRIINAASNICSFIVKFESHTFSVITSDGSSFKPKHVESLHITSGERYDIVLEADQKPRDYIVQVNAYLPCAFKGYAILRYGKSPVKKTTTPEFFDLNQINLTNPEFNDNTFNAQNPKLPGILLSEVENMDVNKNVLNLKADEEFHIFFGTPQVNNSVLFDTSNTIKWMGEIRSFL
jgi:FtsP/CotA-like multicopper oxidase with cupredoxin domain